MNETQNPKSTKEFRIKNGDKILSIMRCLSVTEKSILAFFILILFISSIILINRVNNAFLVSIPSHGGSFNEGIVGLPRSINPVLAFTDIDRDLSTLIYSGLMRYKEGELVNDIAKKYSVSDDGLIYTFILKDNVRFHDGTQLTTDDIEFTIQKIQDNIIKSPRRADWANVTIKKINEYEIQFILKQPYSPFLSNTTVGILPKHIWKKVDAEQFIFNQYNIEPIGSGPFKLTSITKDRDGIPIKYNLSSFNKYYDDEAYIDSISVYFFPNEKLAIEAYKTNIIQSIASISAEEIMKIASSTKVTGVLRTPLPRIFGVFLNQNNAPVFTNKEVREALDISIDRNKLINELLYGYGIGINGPLPFNTINNDTASSTENDKDLAKAILEKAGWTMNSDGVLEKKDKKTTQVLEFSITTADTPELKKATEIIKTEWESIGAKINIKVFEYGDLSQNIIKTRKYDALLFGEFIGKDLDLYAFWHSSQRNSPGLNLAMYVNSKTDKLLESIRKTISTEEKEKIYEDFNKIIKEDIPAIFLYSPEYIYLIPKDIKGINLSQITTPSDRWNDINKWYIKTDKVWSIFAN